MGIATADHAARGLRADGAIDRGAPFEIEIDGALVTAYPGETVAAAAIAAGRYVLGRTGILGAPRGLFCGIGICHECRMVIDGRANVRACLALARPGLRAFRQIGLGAATA